MKHVHLAFVTLPVAQGVLNPHLFTAKWTGRRETEGLGELGQAVGEGHAPHDS